MARSGAVLTARRAFWFLWAALLLGKVVLATRLPLFGDEAWYWLESRHLAWAYSDLPGMTAWLAWLGTAVAGDTWLGVRWPFLAIGMAVPLLVVRLARHLATREGDEASAWHAGSLALLLPLLGGLGVLALPDVPLTLAAILCLDACVRLRERIAPTALAVLALGLVLGALSHYRFVLLLAAGAIGLLADARGRAMLRDARVLVVLALGALAWWPLLQWNLAHGNAGLAFQLHDRHPWALHGGGWILPASQLVVVGPALLAVFVGAVRLALRRRRDDPLGPWNVLLASALLPTAVYVVLGFFADAERVTFHWLLQACLPMLVLAPSVLARWWRAAREAVWLVATVQCLATAALLAMITLPAFRASLADSRWYPDNFAGWSAIASDLRAHPPGAPLLADNFMLGAQLAFALGDPGIAILDHPLNHKHGRAAQLALWQPELTPERLRSADWTLVVEDTAVPLRQRLARYHALCAQLGALASPRVLNVDYGRKRFLRIAPDRAADAACIAPALGWIDTPAIGATVARRFDVTGWAFKDGSGVAHVEVLLDGRPVAQGRYGMPAEHVAAYWQGSTDPQQPNVAFLAQVDAREDAAGEHWLSLRVHGRDGGVEDLPAQRVRFE